MSVRPTAEPNAEPNAAPAYSVVVTDTRGPEALARCAARLRPQCERTGAELIALPAAPGSSIGARRADGLQHARGQWAMMTEPPCLPDSDWVERMIAATRPDVAILGGAVGNARRERASDRAAYFAEYGIYGATGRVALPDGTPHITAANVAYRRDIIPLVAESYRALNGEPAVHMALRANALSFALVPSARVRFDGEIAFADALDERFSHGREYGASQAAGASVGRRLLRAAVALLVLPLLVWRIGVAAEREARQDLVRTFPLVLVLLAGWSLGEAVGWCGGASGKAA